ncbi:MAG: UTRA domain-containing protein [Burkholderiaceae bacterium]
MSATEGASWQRVHAELQRRIRDRVWLPGEIIPAEAEIARELGCARTTVNRAMRELVGAGLVERRRRAGTRVIKTPVRRASFDIPIIREEIERRGAQWGYRLLKREKVVPPVTVANRLGLAARRRALHVASVHFADHRPFLIEDRWVNLDTVPAIDAVDLDTISANEWLVQNAPFTSGEYELLAANATADEAKLLGVAPGAALLIVERMTTDGPRVITSVRLAYAPGHRVQTRL